MPQGVHLGEGQEVHPPPEGGEGDLQLLLEPGGEVLPCGELKIKIMEAVPPPRLQL